MKHLVWFSFPSISLDRRSKMTWNIRSALFVCTTLVQSRLFCDYGGGLVLLRCVVLWSLLCLLVTVLVIWDRTLMNMSGDIFRWTAQSMCRVCLPGRGMYVCMLNTRLSCCCHLDWQLGGCVLISGKTYRRWCLSLTFKVTTWIEWLSMDKGQIISRTIFCWESIIKYNQGGNYVRKYIIG